MESLPSVLNQSQMSEGTPLASPQAQRTIAQENGAESRSKAIDSLEQAQFGDREQDGRHMHARILSVEIEYQATRRLQMDSDEASGRRKNFNFRAVEAYVEAGRFGLGQDGLMSQLRGIFSPDSVAGRIASYALEGFRGQEDPATEAGRAERVQFRGGAQHSVREGVDKALRKLRGLPEQIRSLGDEIYRIVELILDEFAEEGSVSSSQAEGSELQLAIPQTVHDGRGGGVERVEPAFSVSFEPVRIDLVA
jgi:hypothetical protein